MSIVFLKNATDALQCCTTYLPLPPILCRTRSLLCLIQLADFLATRLEATQALANCIELDLLPPIHFTTFTKALSRQIRSQDFATICLRLQQKLLIQDKAGLDYVSPRTTHLEHHHSVSISPPKSSREGWNKRKCVWKRGMAPTS